MSVFRSIRQSAIFKPLVIVLAIGLFTGGYSALLNGPRGDGGTIADTQVTALDGSTVDLGDRQGKPLVLNLWASWCGPCRVEMPMMQEVAAAREDVDIVFANQGEPESRVGYYLASERLSGEDVVMDPDRKLARRFSSAGLPVTLFFRADGSIGAVHIGEISREELLRRIDEVLAGGA